MSTTQIEQVFERRKRRISDEVYEAESRRDRAARWHPLLSAEQAQINARLEGLGLAINRRNLARAQQEQLRTTIARLGTEAKAAATACDDARKSVEAAMARLATASATPIPQTRGASIELRLAEADQGLEAIGSRHAEVRAAQSLLKWAVAEREACEERIRSQGAALEQELLQLELLLQEITPAAEAEEAEIAKLRSRLGAIESQAAEFGPLNDAVSVASSKAYGAMNRLNSEQSAVLLARLSA